jgi:hypothetical protein
MITSIFLNILYALLAFFLSVLPQGGTIPSQWISGVYYAWNAVNAFSFIVPVQTLAWCLGIAMVFHLSILAFKLFHWVITKIPFIG